MGLAPILVDRILNVVLDLKRKGLTLLLVEQNASAALGYRRSRLCARDGRDYGERSGGGHSERQTCPRGLSRRVKARLD